MPDRTRQNSLWFWTVPGCKVYGERRQQAAPVIGLTSAIRAASDLSCGSASCVRNWRGKKSGTAAAAAIRGRGAVAPTAQGPAAAPTGRRCAAAPELVDVTTLRPPRSNRAVPVPQRRGSWRTWAAIRPPDGRFLAGLVTAPIHKASAKAAGLGFCHTELLAARLQGRRPGGMMLGGTEPAGRPVHHPPVAGGGCRRR